MIVFDLKCGKDHIFEVWFADSETYETQSAAGEVSCPVCGNNSVSKAPMAPNVSLRKATETAPVPAPQAGGPTPEQIAHTFRMVRAVQSMVEKNFDNVGGQFPEEARKIHYGDTDKRNIYGDATKEEVEALEDEGIDVGHIPWLPRHDA